MFIAHSEASVQKIHISRDYKIPMCVLNIRYVLVISGNHLISCHTNTSASPHMPANNRHEQLYRSYKISGIDLSRRLIHYSTEPCTCMAVWSETGVDPLLNFYCIRQNILKLSEDKKSRRKTVSRNTKTILTFSQKFLKKIFSIPLQKVFMEQYFGKVFWCLQFG